MPVSCEGVMADVAPADIESIGLRIGTRIPIRGAQRELDALPFVERASRESHVFGNDAGRLHHPMEAEAIKRLPPLPDSPPAKLSTAKRPDFESATYPALTIMLRTRQLYLSYSTSF